jgi:iron complex outermembrane receptor protein
MTQARLFGAYPMCSKQILILIFLSFVVGSYSQTDTSVLGEVTVTSYLQQRPLLRLPSSTAVIDSTQIAEQHGQSLVPVLNTVPGVRMEERSPGSYRLSIRGSLLRSPFGVRNIKVYLDDFPLTNGGGETYINLIDQSAIRSMEILKGPDGSLFGSNSGGVVRLNPFGARPDTFALQTALAYGSFGMMQQNLTLESRLKKSQFYFSEALQKSDGYRDQSAMQRGYFFLGNNS